MTDETNISNSTTPADMLAEEQKLVEESIEIPDKINVPAEEQKPVEILSEQPASVESVIPTTFEKTSEVNEFDGLGGIDDVPPTSGDSELPMDSDDLISSGPAGTEYDWSNAPDDAKAPPRIDLTGQTVLIKRAQIILPPESQKWITSRSGKSEYKMCTFKLHYDVEGQQETYSGMRVFKRIEGGKIKYSHPTITRDRKNQASKLLGDYADFKGKDINEPGLREFMGFLNSQPKALIEGTDFNNPETDVAVKKNMVKKFSI